jgi:penicillin-binding protein 1A
MNYDGKFLGPQTLRRGIEQSRNVMTVRLAQELGMPMIKDYARRFGVYDDMPNYFSYALGAGETTVVRMTTAYAMFANGGKRVRSTLIDRIQDRYGRVVYRHDTRECRGCKVEAWRRQPEPILVDRREQVLDPVTAYQMTSMLEGVIQRGTGTVIKPVGKPVAGKTGTTNNYRDAWFIGFSANLVVGVYMGYDKPHNLGRHGTGGGVAAPIAKDFFMAALADEPAVSFRVPPGMYFVRVDPKTGKRASPSQPGTIMEAFKPGTGPPDGYSLESAETAGATDGAN